MSVLSVALLLGLVGRQGPVAEVPFELVGNHIYIKGTAGDRPISLLLDSGAGMSVLDAGLAEKWGVHMDASSLPVTGAGKSSMKAQMLKDFKVKFDGTSVEQPIIIGIPLDALKYLEGRPIEGVVGFEFFKKYVIQIDYAKSKVRLFTPEGFKYEGVSAAIPVRIVSNHPHLKGEVEVPGVGKLPVEVMIDTGAGSGVSLSGKFVEQQKLDAKLPASPKVPTGAGVGGQTTGRNVRIDSVTLGGFRVDRPLASLDLGSGGVTGATSPFDVLIGGEIMKRFTVTFDYSRNLMYMEPNADLGQPFAGDQTGMYIKADGDTLRNFVVMYIVDGSPAQEAGVKVGDHVVTIDGKPTSNYELFQLKALIREPNKTWSVGLDRDGKSININLKGRPLVK